MPTSWEKEYIFKTEDIVLCQGFEPYALKDFETHFNYNFQDYENWSDMEFWHVNDKPQIRIYRF